VRALGGPVRPQLGETLGRHGLEGGFADEVVVGLVPAGGVHATEGFRVHIADGPDDDLRLGIGAHAATLRGGTA
ncbi:hypothetical protein ABE10_02175, partial [Bacillus toyonensis]|nr:hypothetical protein [Bacillus toyonensis]